MNRFCRFLVPPALVLASCRMPSTTPREDPRQRLLDSWTEHVILANYRSFVERSEVLVGAAAALCDDPSAETLEEAQAAWWDAREPWKRNELIKFGPYRDQPLALGAKLDFWPTRPDAIEEVLASDVELDDQALDGLGAPARGMPTVEYLLWSFEGDIDVVFAPAERRCDYLLAAAADQLSLAEDMLFAWDPEGDDYAAELTDPENGETHADLRAALSEIVNRLGFTLEDMRGEKLGRPLGEQSGGTPQPDLLESRPSARSVRDLLDNLVGVELIYFGADEPEEAVGLADFISTEPRDFNAEMEEHLAACRKALQAIHPLERAISEDAAAVVVAEDCLAAFQTFLQVDVVSELGLSMNFNDNDGD